MFRDSNWLLELPFFTVRLLRKLTGILEVPGILRENGRKRSRRLVRLMVDWPFLDYLEGRPTEAFMHVMTFIWNGGTWATVFRLDKRVQMVMRRLKSDRKWDLWYTKSIKGQHQAVSEQFSTPLSYQCPFAAVIMMAIDRTILGTNIYLWGYIDTGIKSR